MSSNMLLREIDCSENQLTKLDVSPTSINEELRKLNCSHNRLTSLDTSLCLDMWSLDCSYNQLTRLELNKETWDLDYSNNPQAEIVYWTGKDGMIQSVELQTKDVFYTASSHWSWVDDEENGIRSYYRFYEVKPDLITVTMKDGTVFSSSSKDHLYYSLRDAGYDFDVSYFDERDLYDGIWTPGEHEAFVQVGNDWTVSYSFIIETGPVKKIEVPTFTLYEDLVQEDRWSGYDKYYSFPEDVMVTLTMIDGAVITGNIETLSEQIAADQYYEYFLPWGYYYADRVIDPEEDTGFDRMNSGYKWEIGDNKLVFYAGGMETEYNVILEPRLITNVEVTDITYYKDQKIASKPMFTVSLRDGKVIQGDEATVIEELRSITAEIPGFDTFLNNSKFGDSWGFSFSAYDLEAGGELEWYFLGHEGVFNVNVLESPFVAISAETKELYVDENNVTITRTYYGDDGKPNVVEYQNCYDISTIVSVQVETGQTYSGTADEVMNALEKDYIFLTYTEIFFETPSLYGQPWSNPLGSHKCYAGIAQNERVIWVEGKQFFEEYQVIVKERRLPGDVNDDGQVTLMDLVRLCKYLAGYNVEINDFNSDVNGDGQVSLMDLVRLCKYLAGYDVVLE